jgi:hypothetical protein
VAKGWVELPRKTELEKISREKKLKKDRMFQKAAKVIDKKRLKDIDKDIERMKKDSEDLYFKKKAEEDKLVDAFNDKKVKSKTAIKEAKKIIKERAEAEKKNKVTTTSE